MSHLRDLISRTGTEDHTGGIGANVWFATVIAPAPTVYGDPLYVDIPEISFQGEVKFGPCRWNTGSLHADALPQVGDDALVIFDNRQQPWVVAIWQ